MSDEQSIADMSTAKDAEIDNINRELDLKKVELEQTITNLKQWRREHESVHKELTTLEEKHKTLSSLTKEEAEAFENERICLENQLDEKVTEIKELNRINRELKDENDSNSMNMTKLKEKLGFLENELRAMSEKELELMHIQNKKMERISTLEEELRMMEEVRFILFLLLLLHHTSSYLTNAYLIISPYILGQGQIEKIAPIKDK